MLREPGHDGGRAALSNAAQIAFPDRQVVAFVGDGGFTMLGCEFITAVKYNLPIKVVVIKNNVLGQIKWEQMVFLGNPEYGVELQPIDFVKFAEACGGVGSAANDPKRCGAPLRWRSSPRSRRSWRPWSTIRAPMPARTTPKQALHLAESLARGEPTGCGSPPPCSATRSSSTSSSPAFDESANHEPQGLYTGVPIDALEVRAYEVPTDAPKSDGTYEWESTTLVVVEITAGDQRTRLYVRGYRNGDALRQ